MAQTFLASPLLVENQPRHAFRLRHLSASQNRDYYRVDPGVFTTPQPRWMRLVRIGRAIYSYLADADQTGAPVRWCLIGSDSDLALPATLLVGLAVTSNVPDVLASAMFDRVELRNLSSSTLDCSETVVPLGFDVSTAHNGVFPPVEVKAGRWRLSLEGMASAASAVWFQGADRGELATRGFEAKFKAFAAHSGVLGKANPGDGMAFVAIVAGLHAPAIRVDNLLGGIGGLLGYEGGTIRERTECHPSFAVELDLFRGGGEPGNEGLGSPGESGSYHLGIDVNSSVSSLRQSTEFGPTVLPDLFDLLGIQVLVRYQPTGLIEVSLLHSSGKPAGPVVKAFIPPLSGEMIFGFTAATGTATVTQEISDFEVRYLTCKSTPPFRRGDPDGNGDTDITDAIKVLGYLFLGQEDPACLDAADIDDNGSIDITDPINLLRYLFLGGAKLPPPGPDDPCGQDPTPSGLGCKASTNCEGTQP